MENSGYNMRLAQAFIEKAKSDLHSAKALLKSTDYADSVYHAQQCAEKAVKAVLILSNKFIRTHIVSALFREAVESFEASRRKELNALIPKIQELEEHWVLTRYPEPRGGDIWSPSKEYDANSAKEAISKAEDILKALSALLDKKR